MVCFTEMGRQRAQAEPQDLCEILTVAAASQNEILAAIRKDSFADFEDCLQDKCAKEVGADYIITCNVRDFADSEVPAITPEQFLKLYGM